ncbi:hypothetical protein SASPL_132222 [Salvia splendens]|uniref:separase n=1 Tax=Salvia splendens TaxID=180675 RepID=A0A8X8XBN4_SALSN|nr:hypothetical protein SASPL_132222 [Salvia splendens]
MESDASIISKLQSPSPSDIHRLFTAYLHPFTPFLAPSASIAKKPAKSSKCKPKIELPAIRPLAKQFISFIHKALSLIPKRLCESPQIPQNSATELFDSYRLCLDCLEVIAPELSGKQHSVQVQRIRYVHCLENWCLFEEAEAEGFVVLERLNAIAGGELKGKLRKLKARLVPELKEEEEADRELAAIILEVVVTLVKCVSKRSSKIEADYRRVISLVNESESCFKILEAKDYEKFHHFLETNLHIITVFLVAEIKSFSVDLIREFSAVTFKEYKKSCAHDQIYKVALKICHSLFSQRDGLSTDIILDVLKHVLDFMAAECKDGAEKLAPRFLELVCYCANKCQSATVVFCDPVAQYLYRLARFFHQGECVLFLKDFLFISSILTLYASGLYGSSSNQLKGEDSGKCGASLHDTEREKETSGDNHKVISVVVVAALMLSFETNQNIKESTLSVKHVISAQWVPNKRLKYLYVSLNNIAVILKSKKRLKEAFKALKMCCKALWNHIVDLCKIEMTKSQVSVDYMSEKSIPDLVMEASDKVAFLLQLNEECNFKVNGIIRESIICWSNSENLIATLPAPLSLIKEWVKIQYKLLDDNEHGVMLYPLLSSSKEISKRALGKLLEEELFAYNEKSYLNPRYSLKMKMKVINVLLEEIYVTNESTVEKCRVLIQKAKSLRALGLEQLDKGIQCLSDAVSTLKLTYVSRRRCSSQADSLLIHAYLLRALYTHEAAPHGFLDDIHDALNLCLHPDHCHEDEQYEDMLYLWYQLIDLLSIQGYLEIHPRLYDVVIKLFNKKNIQFAKTLAELWKNKRLSHALCASPCMEELKPLVVGFHHINSEIKQAASDLISSVPITSCASFLSSNLYYDLSARLISSGQMIEALTYAKEAHRLRSKLLQQKFEYSVEKVVETFDMKGELIDKIHYSVQTFKVNDFVVTKGSCDYEGSVLTPWNVLSCYLESILQVGFVQETLGNVSEAEMLLQWGRNVAQFQNLPLFEVSFSCLLGKLYRKQKLWSLSEKELSCAKKGLADNLNNISCKKCLCMWEISINQQIGDLILSSSCCSEEPPSPKTLSSAKILYKLALDKLNLSDWGTLYSTSEESLANDKCESKVEARRSKRTKKEAKPASQKQDTVCRHSRRITRSVHRSLVETHEIEPAAKETGPSSGSANEYLMGVDSKSFSADLQSEIRSLCSKMKCWQCLHVEAGECCNLSIFVFMNWELVHRKLSLRLLMSIGKFSGMIGYVHEAHEILLQSLSVLFSRNCSKHSSDSLPFLIESVGKYYPEDALAVERATLLYFICWFAVKSNCYQSTSIPSSNRNFCCELSRIGTVRVQSLLKLSFILCRDVPVLLQKVSRLLAVIYVLSTSLEQFSLSSNEQGSESQWASFFHQASLGTQLNQQLLSGIMQKKQNQSAGVSEDLDSVLDILDFPHSLRCGPESCEDLEEFVLDFFQGLPSTPVICISLVAGADASLLKDLLHCSPKVQAWILLSHLSSDNQHVVLLPVHEILKEEASDEESGSSSIIYNCKDFVKQWQCPWISSVIDDIAPLFRHVLEGNYYSSSEYFLESIRENTSLWWTQRNRLNECLCRFLQDVEDSWLGTWKYLLLGMWPSCNHLDSIKKSLSQDEMDLLQHVVTKKCYVGLTSEETSMLLFNSMLEMSDSVDQAECISGKPIILVLDTEVQMLPWECLPILRNQEVYRMPSIGSIFATLDRHCENQKPLELSDPVFPLIDPLDSYYLLNPDGDLSRTQVEFESWFKNQDIIEGKIGTVPTVEELSLALKDHDLFIYFGHGSGTQYIPGHEIQKLDGCAATLLLGCSSGSLYLRGSYMPHGAPLSYILAGSPVIVANLWEVTDKDIDRFGKAMLNAWLRERSTASSECARCVPTKCIHRPRIASFMAQARDACNLGFLIGASPVCYGVPTGIIKRKGKNR